MTKSVYKDYFSEQAQDYALYRPSYPAELFNFLSSLTKEHDYAWDCATGSGQVATALIPYFQRVIATDVSEQQIKHACLHQKINYRVQAAEESDIASGSIDLLTIAQALHWLDLERFYLQAQRILKPDGVIAAWCYGRSTISEQIDRIFNRFYNDIVGPYWPPERKFIENGYRDLSFPFVRLVAPEFSMQTEWNLSEFLGYLGTWSASQRFIEQRGFDPREEVAEDFIKAWGSRDQVRVVQWPLYLLVGRR